MRASELAATPSARAARGAWYTPREAAESITALAFGAGTYGLVQPGTGTPRFVVDPTCGGGAFLLAALDAFVARGVSPTEALGRIGGLDSDAGAVAVARRVIGRWGQLHGVASQATGRADNAVQIGDALGPWPGTWPTPDLIVGNPPFASPLRSAAGPAGLPPAAVEFRDQHRAELGPYADLAAIHLLNAAERIDARSGRLALVLPQSILAGRDATALREWVDANLPVQTMWVTDERIFDASVRVCAPVLARGAAPSEASLDGRSWAARAADASGLPVDGVDPDAERLGSLCSATAGFRDEYYGLAAACVEASEGDTRCRLATVGSIDPLVSHWGASSIRFAKKRWDRPVIDEALLPDGIRSWFERQRRPKVLLPTQARVLEPFVDRSGSIIPVTPLVSIFAEPEHLDHIAALLLAPNVVAWAARRSFGSALASTAIKLRASDVLHVPLPAERSIWDRAAALVPNGPEAVEDIAALMLRSFGGDESLLSWWRERKG